MAFTEQAQAAKREYQRKWREGRREEMRQYYRDYYQTHKEQVKKNQAAYWARKAAVMEEIE